MTYEYTDRMDAQLRIHDDKDDVLLVCETAKGEFGGVLLPNEDAPRIALEILKHAGFDPLETGDFHADGSTDHVRAISQSLADYLAASSTDNRRRELMQLLTYSDAINRIIELEAAS